MKTKYKLHNSPKLLSNSTFLFAGDRGPLGCNDLTTFDDEYSSRRCSLVVILQFENYTKNCLKL